MKHVQLFEGWLDSLTSGFSGKSKPEPEDYSYQKSKFRDASDMWSHPERYNKDVYRDYDAALKELETDLGTREILSVPFMGDEIFQGIYDLTTPTTSLGTSSFAGNEPKPKDPCDGEIHILKIDPNKEFFSNRYWYEYHNFHSYYFMNERIGFITKGRFEYPIHTFFTKDFYHKWLEDPDKLADLRGEIKKAYEYRFWKTDPKMIASRYTKCEIDTLFSVADEMERSQGEDFLIACDLDQRIKKDPSITFSLFHRLKKSGYDKLLKSLQGEISDDTISTISDLGELGF